MIIFTYHVKRQKSLSVTGKQLLTSTKQRKAHFEKVPFLTFFICRLSSFNLTAQTYKNTHPSPDISYTHASVMCRPYRSRLAEFDVELEAKETQWKSRDVLLDNWRRASRDQMAPGAPAREAHGQMDLFPEMNYLQPHAYCRHTFVCGMPVIICVICAKDV